MATFESMDRRMPKIEACLKANGLESLDAANEMLLAKGIDCDKIIRGVQPICFDNAVWAYTLGTAIAVKRGLKSASDCAAAIGEGLEAFTIPGSVAEQRKVGLGHGNLGAMLLHEDTEQTQQLIEEIGLPAPECYTYPFGACSEESERILREMGFLCTLGCEERINTVTRDPESLYQLGRFNRAAFESTDDFLRRALGE